MLHMVKIDKTIRITKRKTSDTFELAFSYITAVCTRASVCLYANITRWLRYLNCGWLDRSIRETSRSSARIKL